MDGVNLQLQTMDAVVQFGDNQRLDTLSSCSDKEATLQKYPLKRQTMGGFFQVKAATARIKKHVYSLIFRRMKRKRKRDQVKSRAFDIQTRQGDDVSIVCDLDGIDTVNNEIEIEEEINSRYPSYPLCSFQELEHLELHGDERVKKVVFDMDRQPQLLHPNLKVLKLFDLGEMSHVWKCRWSEFLIPQHQPLRFPFQNLTHIYLQYCHKTKYLFSPHMAKYLSNLEYVDIYICHGIEEVVSSRDDEMEESIASTSPDVTTTFFPHLETFKLYYLNSLKQIDSGAARNRSGIISSSIMTQGAQVMGWSFCQYAKQISVEKCRSLESLIPWNAASQMQRLEELIINDCATMTEIFESKSFNGNSDVDDGSAHGITSTSASPTLNNATTLVPHLANLKSVSVSDCDLLPYIFTFSTVESLKQLEVLRIKRCKTIQVIVNDENVGKSLEVVFPSLHTLELDHLPNLKAFFLGNNDFQCPILDDVTVNECPQLMTFTAGHSRTPKLEFIRTSLGIHSLERGLSLQNLISISRKHPNIERIIPSNAVGHLQKLETIRVTDSYRLEEVFGVAVEVKNDDGSNELQTVHEVPNLRQMHLESLRRLKYLYNSKRSVVLEFPNLTTVSIHDCMRLEYVFSSSMVPSLVRLSNLHISECKSLEVIVKEDEEHDAKGCQIILPLLKSLKLHDLPILKGFFLGKDDFSCPSLETLQIIRCPTVSGFTMGNFATPELKLIDTSFGIFKLRDDLNSFIKTKQEEGHEF